jgi:hypothetical protein
VHDDVDSVAVPRRPLVNVLDDCQLLAGAEAGDNATIQRRRALAQELATHPELYYILSDITQGNMELVATEPEICTHGEGIRDTEEQEIGGSHVDVDAGNMTKTVVEEGCLVMEDDVAKYFELQQGLRREYELKQKEQLIFGGK